MWSARISKPFSIVDTHDTGCHLFRSSWIAYFVKLSPADFPICESRMTSSDNKNGSLLNSLLVGTDWVDASCSFNLFRYTFRQSFSVPDNSSRSISIVAIKKAFRCVSLNGKVWIKFAKTNSLAFIRVADDIRAKPCYHKNKHSNR